jgi:flagellar hook-basal body complex protein FliE
MIPEISSIRTLQSIQQALASREVSSSVAQPGGEATGAGFSKALDSLTAMQAESDRAIEKLIAGEEVDLHQVMLSVEKMDLAFRVALQLRNKLVQAYQEIMRMQV